MHQIAMILDPARFAYIDPNAGGWLFQLLFPVFTAIGGAWIVFRKRVKALLERRLGRKNRKPGDHE